MIDFTTLRHVGLFASVPDAELQQMAASIHQRELANGDVLFKQGEQGDDCYVILAGALEVIAYLADNELQLEVRHAGQIIGEMALIDRHPRSATVRAVGHTRVVVLNQHHFIALLRSNPELMMHMLREGTTRVRSTNQRMISDLEQKNLELSQANRELQAVQGNLIRLNRMEEELTIARRIQESFLPTVLAQPTGWQIAAYSRGAQAVGGDFFDCIDMGDQVGLIVADVCGKGVTAALFVALTRTLLRAASQAPWAFQGGVALDAETLLTGALWLTNDYITREHDSSNMFVTAFYAMLEPATGRVVYANAGHNPPILVAAQGVSLRLLEDATLPLGIFPGQNFDTTEARIAPGEVLVLFSDGITEAMNSAGEPYGDERFAALLCQHAAADATTLVDIVVRDVDAYVAGAPQADDMTLLVAKRNATA